VTHLAAHKLAHVQSHPHRARHSLLTARAFSRLLGSKKACIASAEEAPKTAATAAADAGVDTAAAVATGTAVAGRFARGMCACGGGGSGSCSGSDKLTPARAVAATAAAA
jgi:hypothetical protein